MNANTTAYLVLVAVPGPTVVPLLPPGVVNVPSVGQTWTLQPGKNILGRESGPDVTVLLPWNIVSRRHILIELFSAGMWEIEDLNSRNKTTVNGQKLQPHTLCPLHDGDLIHVGFVELRFCLQLDPDAKVVVSDGYVT